MLRPTTLCRATQPLRQLAISTPITPVILPLNQSLIHLQQTREKSTINKHRLPKKKFLGLRTHPAQDSDASSPVQQQQTPPAVAEPAAPTSSSEPRGPAPFVINRTASQNLPVYQLSKRGGNKKLTQIRKLIGQSDVLAAWLAEDLGLDKKKVRVKYRTNHVELEGEHVEAVKAWFEARGF